MQEQGNSGWELKPWGGWDTYTTPVPQSLRVPFILTY
jgi:hypothetical protein